MKNGQIVKCEIVGFGNIPLAEIAFLGRENFQYLLLTRFSNVTILTKSMREKVKKTAGVIFKTDVLRDALMVQFELFGSLKIVKMVKATLQKERLFYGQKLCFWRGGDWGNPNKWDCGGEIAER